MYAIGDVATFREVVETGAEAGEYEDEFLASDQRVGYVTSSSWGPSVNKMLALAYVDTAHAWPGRNLLVQIGGRPVPAKVVPTPFFDPEMARARSRPEDDQLRSKPTPSPVPALQGRRGTSTGISAPYSGNGR